MKKTINLLVEKIEKLQEKKDGILQGGFGSIKGGFHVSNSSTNDNCDCPPPGQPQTNASHMCTNTSLCFM